MMKSVKNDVVARVGVVCLTLGLAIMISLLGFLLTFEPVKGGSFSFSWAPIDLFLVTVGYHALWNRSRVAFRSAVAAIGWGSLLLFINSLMLWGMAGQFPPAPFDPRVLGVVLLVLSLVLGALYRQARRPEALESTDDDTSRFPEKKASWKLFRALPGWMQVGSAFYVVSVIVGMFSLFSRVMATF